MTLIVPHFLTRADIAKIREAVPGDYRIRRHPETYATVPGEETDLARRAYAAANRVIQQAQRPS